MEMNYDENTLHEIEQELHIPIYPGTEIMADVGSHHFVKASDHAHHVLVPQPSDNPNDPLNWSRGWKTSAMICATAVSFAQGMGPLSLAPMFPELIEAFDSNLTDAVQFTGVAILVLGFSNFIWVPIATSFGRRPVYIFSTIICLASMIWRAQAKTYGSFMGACILNGIGSGPAETAQPTVIADMMFLHDRGAYNTLYFCFYFGSLMVGPIIAGPMAYHTSWRDFWWLNVALHGVILIMVIFGLPETKWHRRHPDEVIVATTVPSSEKVDVDMIESTDPEKANPPNARSTITQGLADLTPEATAQRDPFLGKGYPSKKQFALFQPNSHPFRSIIIDLWTPWKLFAFPIIEFAAFVVSWSAASFLTLNLTQSENFAAPPYNFSSQTIGFFNFATLIGAIIGLVTNGPLSDWISMKATMRNRGIREPEMRLPTLIPYTIIMLIGNFIVAFGYQYKWDWRIIVILGYTATGIQVAAIPSIASTYAVDSYKPVAGSIFVAITVNKNVWGYGFSKFITPWVEKDGYVPPIMTNMCLVFLFCATGVIFYYRFGKWCRKVTKDSGVHKM
ncbi:MAG: hypothetical protein M1834_000967 [Cirrosporium novae-zelandiae]|nr:MAG: hypothetical protein M1834_000967 [Cirrosporium novae-zelandiae]